MDEESKTKQGQPDDANEFLHRELIVTFRLNGTEDFEVTARTKKISMDELMTIRRIAHERFVSALEQSDLSIEPDYEVHPVADYSIEYVHCEDTEAGMQINLEFRSCDCVDNDNFRDRIAILICRVEPAFTEGLRRQGIKFQ